MDCERKNTGGEFVAGKEKIATELGKREDKEIVCSGGEMEKKRENEGSVPEKKNEKNGFVESQGKTRKNKRKRERAGKDGDQVKRHTKGCELRGKEENGEREREGKREREKEIRGSNIREERKKKKEEGEYGKKREGGRKKYEKNSISWGKNEGRGRVWEDERKIKIKIIQRVE